MEFHVCYTYQMFIYCSFVQKIDVMYEITYFITICGNNDIVPGRYLLQRSLSYLYICINTCLLNCCNDIVPGRYL
jgi:hypothetical protein